jgi:hypothetical protein
VRIYVVEIRAVRARPKGEVPRRIAAVSGFGGRISIVSGQRRDSRGALRAVFARHVLWMRDTFRRAGLVLLLGVARDLGGFVARRRWSVLQSGIPHVSSAPERHERGAEQNRE